jgi:hypothetical protein
MPDAFLKRSSFSRFKDINLTIYLIIFNNIDRENPINMKKED